MNLSGDKKYTLDIFKTGYKFSCTFHLPLGTFTGVLGYTSCIYKIYLYENGK